MAFLLQQRGFRARWHVVVVVLVMRTALRRGYPLQPSALWNAA